MPRAVLQHGHNELARLHFPQINEHNWKIQHKNQWMLYPILRLEILPTQRCARTSTYCQNKLVRTHSIVLHWVERHVRENKATHKAYELWHKSFILPKAGSSPPFHAKHTHNITCCSNLPHSNLQGSLWKHLAKKEYAIQIEFLFLLPDKRALFCLILFFSLVSGTHIQDLNNSDYFTGKYQLIIYLCN